MEAEDRSKVLGFEEHGFHVLSDTGMHPQQHEFATLLRVCAATSFRTRQLPRFSVFLNIYRPRVATRNCANFSNKPDDCANRSEEHVTRRDYAAPSLDVNQKLVKGSSVMCLTCSRLISETLVTDYQSHRVIGFSFSESFTPDS